MRRALLYAVVVCVAFIGLLAVGQLTNNSQASDTFTGTQMGYTGALQTVVPAAGFDPDVPMSVKNYSPNQSPPDGRAAIRPPITRESVREYVLTNAVTVGGAAATNMQITNIQFMPIRELKKLLANDPLWDMWADDYPVVYVTLNGSVSLTIEDSEQVYRNAYRVFDARTGNELQAGVGVDK
jgi:hypothetical protein